ncbi:MAG: rhodanese-like domain-containing protein [Pseudomonadota bacterium]
MSTDSASLAAEAGYKNVKVMLAGVPGWQKAGNHVVASNDFVEKSNIVLVDLRNSADYKKGHIPRAYNIPFSNLEDVEDDFPENKTAPIVFYGDNAVKAFKMAKKWGYKGSAVYEGGLDAWTAAGKSLVTTVAPKEINWVRILEPGEISIADFEKVVEKHPADMLILDVRSNDEIKDGMFANAVHIPLDELGAKMNALPKDKEILVHCTTGARAEMAYQELKKGGFKTRYVVGNVECDSDDGCEISE